MLFSGTGTDFFFFTPLVRAGPSRRQMVCLPYIRWVTVQDSPPILPRGRNFSLFWWADWPRERHSLYRANRGQPPRRENGKEDAVGIRLHIYWRRNAVAACARPKVDRKQLRGSQPVRIYCTHPRGSEQHLHNDWRYISAHARGIMGLAQRSDTNSATACLAKAFVQPMTHKDIRANFLSVGGGERLVCM